MDHLIYTAMSGASAAAARQGVLANNLANASTQGFRAELSAYRAVPLRAKQLSSLMMVLGCSWAWWPLPPHVGWLPVLLCSAVALWLWSLPTAARRAEPPSAQG